MSFHCACGNALTLTIKHSREFYWPFVFLISKITPQKMIILHFLRTFALYAILLTLHQRFAFTFHSVCISDTVASLVTDWSVSAGLWLWDLAPSLRALLCARYCMQGHHLAAPSSSRTALRLTERMSSDRNKQPPTKTGNMSFFREFISLLLFTFSVGSWAL